MTTMTDERPFTPDYAVPPGETLADLLDERDMTQTELARRLGVSLKHVNQVIKGAAPISAELALGLEKVLGPSVSWLKREAVYQGKLAELEEREELAEAVDWAKQFPVVELKKRGYIPARATGVELVVHVLRFFGIAQPEQWTDPLVAYRKTRPSKATGTPFQPGCASASSTRQRSIATPTTQTASSMPCTRRGNSRASSQRSGSRDSSRSARAPASRW